MKEHAERNNNWDRSQLGTCSGVQGTVDQLIIIIIIIIIKIWRKHLSKLEEVPKGNHVLCEKDKKEMIRKYDLEATGYVNVISQLKVKVHNGSFKLKNYEIK